MSQWSQKRIQFVRFCTFIARLMMPLWSVPFFVLLLFLGAMFWAKSQDSFSRKWFALKTADGHFVKCVAVFPKPMRRYPVLIYAHGAGDNLMNDGNDLRQMAELGMAAVDFEYDKTDKATFNSQFESLLRYVNQQKWADTKAIAWVGFSLGANRMLDFALYHPEQQPQLFVQLSGVGLLEGQTDNELKFLRCRVMLIHGDQDDIFPVADTKRLVSALRTDGCQVELKIILGAPHNMEPEHRVIFRCIGEYCLMHLVGKDAWQNYHSIAQWQAEAPPFWLFCLPALAWAIGCFAWWWRHKPAPVAKNKLKRHEIILRWLAALLAAWALVVTAIHLLTPQFTVNKTTLSIARKFVVAPKERIDFEYLVAQPIWHGQKLQVLLTHVELANYNRELINWQVDGKNYQDYVLLPVITGQLAENFNWRRPLWEEFYPRIRHEASPEDAARIVVRHLRARVTIADLPNLPHDVPTIWLKQITDKTGFEIIYVATLRSVGVPARLDSNGQAEIFADRTWQPAPQPVVMKW